MSVWFQNFTNFEHVLLNKFEQQNDVTCCIITILMLYF